MKPFTKVTLIIIFLFTVFESNAQWTQTAFDSTQVFMLKRANGKLFTYAYNFNTYQGAMYVSTDSGSTWNSADSSGAFKDIYVYDITYDSAHSDYVLLANGQDGVYYSSDGYSWKNSGSDYNGAGIVYIHNQDVLSNTGIGAAISTNGGLSWTTSQTGLTYPYYAHSLVRVHDTLYIALQGSGSFISTNYGSNWLSINDSEDFNDCFFEHNNIVYSGLYIFGVGYFQDGQFKYDTAGLPLTTDTWALADAGDTLFCGGDNGAWMNYTGRWQDFSCGLPENHTVLKLLHVSHYLFAGTDTGLYEMDLHNSNCANSSAVETVTVDNSVKIYPNVTDGIVTISSPSAPQYIELVNVNGQVVQVARNVFKVDISALPQGIYFMRMVMNNGQVFSGKIVKQ